MDVRAGWDMDHGRWWIRLEADQRHQEEHLLDVGDRDETRVKVGECCAPGQPACAADWLLFMLSVLSAASVLICQAFVVD